MVLAVAVVVGPFTTAFVVGFVVVLEDLEVVEDLAARSGSLVSAVVA